MLDQDLLASMSLPLLHKQNQLWKRAKVHLRGCSNTVELKAWKDPHEKGRKNSSTLPASSQAPERHWQEPRVDSPVQEGKGERGIGQHFGPLGFSYLGGWGGEHGWDVRTQLRKKRGGVTSISQAAGAPMVLGLLCRGAQEPSLLRTAALRIPTVLAVECPAVPTTPQGPATRGLWQLKPVASTTTVDCTSPPLTQRSRRNFPLQTWIVQIHLPLGWQLSPALEAACVSSQYAPRCMRLQSGVYTPLALATTAASPGLLLLDTEASWGSPTVLVDFIALMAKDHLLWSNFLSPQDTVPQPQSRSHYMPAHPVPWATRIRATVSFPPKFCLHTFFQHWCTESQDFWHHQPQGDIFTYWCQTIKSTRGDCFFNQKQSTKCKGNLGNERNNYNLHIWNT